MNDSTRKTEVLNVYAPNKRAEKTDEAKCDRTERRNGQIPTYVCKLVHYFFNN